MNPGTIHPLPKNLAGDRNQGLHSLAKRDKLFSILIILLASLLVLSASSITLAGQGFRSSGVCDVNRDGIPDLLLTDSETGELLVRSAGDSSRMVEEQTGIIVASSQTVRGVADFNRDGNPDLLLLDLATGSPVIWYLRNWDVISQATVGRPTGAYELAGVGDFNRDGSPDLLWSNSATGEAVAWYMAGTTHLATAPVSTLLPPWHIVGVGDGNGDGSPDILFANPCTGEVVVCCMRGISRLDESGIASRAPPWTIPKIFAFDGQWAVNIVWQHIDSLSSFSPSFSESTFFSAIPSLLSIRAPPIGLRHS